MATPEKRTRTLPIHQFRSEQREDGKHYISGYAALFNVLSEPIAPGIREKLAPGCFAEALLTSDTTANIEHDDRWLLGRKSAGTLVLQETELGLYFECEVPDTSYARDLAVLMQRGDVTKNSFAFTVNPDEDIQVERVSDAESIETVNRVRKLLDVAIIMSRPAYPQTFNAFRSDPESTAEGHPSNAGDSQAEAEARTRKASIALEIARLELATQAIED